MTRQAQWCAPRESAVRSVTEIGAVRVRGGEVVGQWASLINPETRIASRIVLLAGITNQMVADARKFADIADEFREFIGNAVFVGHRVAFDYGFIRTDYARLNEPFRRPTLCTVARTRKFFPRCGYLILNNYDRNMARNRKWIYLPCRSRTEFSFIKNYRRLLINHRPYDFWETFYVQTTF